MRTRATPAQRNGWRLALGMSLELQIAWAGITWLLLVVQAATVDPVVAVLWIALPSLLVIAVLAVVLVPIAFVEAAVVEVLRLRSPRLGFGSLSLFAVGWATAVGVLLGSVEVLGQPAKLGSVLVATIGAVAYGGASFVIANRAIASTTAVRAR